MRGIPLKMKAHGGILIPALLLTLIPVWTGCSWGAVFRDALGRNITLETPPRRIVSLAPSITEILYFLGLGDRVVGVTRFSSYPPEAARKTKVGSYIHLNVEKIISLNPDLVIGTKDGNKPGPISLLEEAHLQVFIVNPRNVMEVIETVSTLGRVCGVAERAERLSRELLHRVERIVAKTAAEKSPVVFLQINVRPIIAVNRETFHHDLIQLAGGINMTGDESAHYPRISLEEVIRRKPEVILISCMEREGTFETARREWLKWSSIPAVQQGRVYLIDSDLIDRASPRLVLGLEKMVRLIHPKIQ